MTEPGDVGNPYDPPKAALTVPATRRGPFLKWYLFSFQGRIGRGLYWLFLALALGLFLLLALLLGAVSPDSAVVILNVLSLAVIWPSLAVQAKRWHDIDRSAWWILINFVPVVGGILALVANGFLPGTKGMNRFGPDPAESEPVAAARPSAPGADLPDRPGP